MNGAPPPIAPEKNSWRVLLQADLLAGVSHSVLRPLVYPTTHLSSGKIAAYFIYTLDSEPGATVSVSRDDLSFDLP